MDSPGPTTSLNIARATTPSVVKALEEVCELAAPPIGVCVPAPTGRAFWPGTDSGGNLLPDGSCTFTLSGGGYTFNSATAISGCQPGQPARDAGQATVQSLQPEASGAQVPAAYTWPGKVYGAIE